MTQSPRTIAQITASIDFLVPAITDMEGTVADLRAALSSTCRAVVFGRGWVVGFNNGLFLNHDQTNYTGVVFARRFDEYATAYRARVRNGRGEVPKVYSYEAALDLSIKRLEHALDGMRECLVSCQLELNDAYALERAADQAAWLELGPLSIG